MFPHPHRNTRSESPCANAAFHLAHRCACLPFAHRDITRPNWKRQQSLIEIGSADLPFSWSQEPSSPQHNFSKAKGLLVYTLLCSLGIASFPEVAAACKRFAKSIALKMSIVFPVVFRKLLPTSCRCASRAAHAGGCFHPVEPRGALTTIPSFSKLHGLRDCLEPPPQLGTQHPSFRKKSIRNKKKRKASKNNKKRKASKKNKKRKASKKNKKRKATKANKE